MNEGDKNLEENNIDQLVFSQKKRNRKMDN